MSKKNAIVSLDIEVSGPCFGRNREASTKFFQTTRNRIVRDKTKYNKNERRKNAVKSWE